MEHLRTIRNCCNNKVTQLGQAQDADKYMSVQKVLMKGATFSRSIAGNAGQGPLCPQVDSYRLGQASRLQEQDFRYHDQIETHQVRFFTFSEFIEKVM